MGQKLQYPEARKQDVVDDYHGTKVPDPYRWLEDLDAPDTVAWVEAQNRLTDAYLQRHPARAWFKARIQELWNFRKTNLPVLEGERLFYRMNTGLQLQAPLYMRERLDAPPTLVLDPNALWPDGTTSLAAFEPSPASYLAYAYAEGGADWQTIKVRDLTTGQDIPDEVAWVRFSGTSWTRDSKGFFYARYPEPPAGQVMEAPLSGHALYYHVLGTAQSSDPLIYTNTTNPSWFVSGTLTDDGRYLLVSTSKGADNNNRLYVADLGDPLEPALDAPITAIFEEDDAELSPVGAAGSVLFLRTDRDAPNRRIVSVDLGHGVNTGHRRNTEETQGDGGHRRNTGHRVNTGHRRNTEETQGDGGHRRNTGHRVNTGRRRNTEETRAATGHRRNTEETRAATGHRRNTEETREATGRRRNTEETQWAREAATGDARIPHSASPIPLEPSASCHWTTVIPESAHAIENATVAAGRLFVEYLVDVKSRLAMFDLHGAPLGDVALPAAGSLAGMAGRQDSRLLFYVFASHLYPATVFSYDPAAGVSAPFDAAEPPVDVTRFETTQMFAVSRDGTRVPFFMTAKKGLPRDGTNPAMVYAYGGFSISVTPAYRPDVPAWLELGGIWVTANLRGGAEYGEAWHRAGMLEKKQNVFDDFIAVVEHLVAEGYTSPDTLGLMGGSNGGLLVGTVMEQRPDLFAVALPAVGVMDMLRYDRFTGGRAWATEYGSAQDPRQFAVLVKYSPLHNLTVGACYPATLVTTADHDDRVVPSHSFKFAAALQAAQGCDTPVLIRVETGGSHNFRSTDKRIAELADEWTFAAAAIGIAIPNR